MKQIKSSYKRLQRALSTTAFQFTELHSRTHSLHSFNTAVCKVFLKRDDELSCSVSGSKFRKYASLLPCLIKSKVQEIILIGGGYSNNILGLTQLLIENGIHPTLFLRKPGNDRVEGNLLLTKMLVEEDQIHWISRESWKDVDELAAVYANERNTKGVRTVVFPEGAFTVEALPGAVTLSLDVMRNEIANEIQFDHIFVDAGTGLQACALILAHAWCNHPAKIHVVLLAQQENEFLYNLEGLRMDFELLVKGEMDFPKNFTLHRPTSAISFGSVNREVIQFIKDFAKTEGVFVDPIYSGKLMREASRLIVKQQLEGNVLLVHSGGVMTLAGFQSRLL